MKGEGEKKYSMIILYFGKLLSIIQIFGNHFDNISPYDKSNKYIFYGTPALFYRNRPESHVQWFIKDDPFRLIDSIDFFSSKRLRTYWIPDICLLKEIEKDTLVVSNDVSDKDFCNFMNENAREKKVIKLGFRHPRCHDKYEYIRPPITRGIRLNYIASSEYYAKLTNQKYI